MFKDIVKEIVRNEKEMIEKDLYERIIESNHPRLTIFEAAKAIFTGKPDIEIALTYGYPYSPFFEIKEKYGDDDWEQIYFDALADKYDTDSQQVISHMYYWDNDTIGETAQGILEAVVGKKLLQFDCFDDSYNSITVVVGIVEK